MESPATAGWAANEAMDWLPMPRFARSFVASSAASHQRNALFHGLLPQDNHHSLDEVRNKVLSGKNKREDDQLSDLMESKSMLKIMILIQR